MADWKETNEQNINLLREMGEGLASFTEAFNARARDYHEAVSAIDARLSRLDSIVEKGCSTLEDRSDILERETEAFERARESAESWMDEAVEARKSLEKAISEAGETFRGISEALASIRESYEAAVRIKESAVPALQKAAEDMKTAVAAVALQAPARENATTAPSFAGNAEFSALKKDVADLKKAVESLDQGIRMQMASRASYQANSRQISEKVEMMERMLSDLRMANEKNGGLL